jgi:hypothetical protein
MRSRYLAIGALLASPLHAQTLRASAVHVLTGLVFDSVGNVPLSGAVVQVESVDSTRRSFSAITDATGHYRIAGVPSGRFAIGFQHRSLDALGLESPLSAVELGVRPDLDVDLAIPSGAVVRAQRCPKTINDTTVGMLAGFVADPQKGSAVGASVAIQWIELARIGGKFATATQTMTAAVGAEGTYLACGVPSDTWLTVRLAETGYHVIDGHAAVPPGGVMRQDFTLVDSNVMRGTAALTGRVLREDRTPLASGRATISALAVDVPIRDGQFSMTGLPSGTWDVEARAVGFEPHSVLVQLSDHTVDSTLITITTKAQTLETVSIVGQPSGDLKVLDAIVARSRVASGTIFLPGNSWLKSADTPADVLRAARGFSLKSPTLVEARPVFQVIGKTMINAPCSSKDSIGSTRNAKPKTIAVYVDGARLASGVEGLYYAVPMNAVLAIEAYPDVLSAPFLWRTNDACAVIAVWTKR